MAVTLTDCPNCGTLASVDVQDVPISINGVTDTVVYYVCDELSCDYHEVAECVELKQEIEVLQDDVEDLERLLKLYKTKCSKWGRMHYRLLGATVPIIYRNKGRCK